MNSALIRETVLGRKKHIPTQGPLASAVTSLLRDLITISGASMDFEPQMFVCDTRLAEEPDSNGSNPDTAMVVYVIDMPKVHLPVVAQTLVFYLQAAFGLALVGPDPQIKYELCNYDLPEELVKGNQDEPF